MSAKISHHAIETALALISSGKVSQHVIEVLVTNPVKNPTTPTGVSISQDVIEVLVALTPAVEVSQHVLEVLCSLSDVTLTPASQNFGFGYVS